MSNLFDDFDLDVQKSSASLVAPKSLATQNTPCNPSALPRCPGEVWTNTCYTACGTCHTICNCQSLNNDCKGGATPLTPPVAPSGTQCGAMSVQTLCG